MIYYCYKRPYKIKSYFFNHSVKINFKFIRIYITYIIYEFYLIDENI
jgi:hypothetical protein